MGIRATNLNGNSNTSQSTCSDSRNSSGQSAGSVGDSSDQEHSDEYFHLSASYFQSNPKPPSRRLDLSELSSETKDQELPISSFLDDILSPKKFKVKDEQIYLSACLRHWRHKLQETSSLYNFVAKIDRVKT